MEQASYEIDNKLEKFSKDNFNTLSDNKFNFIAINGKNLSAFTMVQIKGKTYVITKERDEKRRYTI